MNFLEHIGPRRLAQAATVLAVLAPAAALAEFGPATTLTGPGRSAQFPQVGVDADGDAVIVWKRSNGTNDVVKALSRSAAGALGPVQNISPANLNSFDPQIGVAADGDAVIVWTGNDGNISRVQARSRSAAGALGPVQTLSPAGVDAFLARVAVAPDGRAVIVWRLSDRVQARARSAAGVLSATQTLSATGSAVDDPDVGIADNGSAVFVWLRLQGSVFRLEARGRTAGGVLGPIQLVSFPAASVGDDPDIAVDASGDALIAWTNLVGIDSHIQARSRNSAGTLGPVKNLSPGEGDGLTPAIAMQDDGDAIVVWRRKTIIQARTSSAAGTLGAIQNISPLSGSSETSQVAYDENGVAVFVWRHRSSNATPKIQARSRSAAGVLGPIDDIARVPPQFVAREPQVAMDNGIATAVWEREDNSSNLRIQAATGP